MKVGFVLTETVEGRFVPWESFLEWESYLDLYCKALGERGMECVKYVPSIEVRKTVSYRHRLGHEVKRIPVNSRLVYPKILSRPRPYIGGLTTTSHQLEAVGFTANLYREARRDGVDVLHYASYYSTFFVASILVSSLMPTVAQYTGGSLPAGGVSRQAWRGALIPALRMADTVLIGPYPAEVASLRSATAVPASKMSEFNAPVVDTGVFSERDPVRAKRELGFDEHALHLLSVSFIPRRHSEFLAKNPFRMVDLFGAAKENSDKAMILHLVGFGPGMEELKGYVGGKGVSDSVIFHGKVEHTSLPRYYSASDLVFVPYPLLRLNEGSVTVEAFACKRPVAAFRRSEAAPVEQPGGFLVDMSPEGGGRQLGERITNHDYLVRKGTEGRELAERYSLRAAGQALDSIYNKVLGRGDRGARRR